MDQKIKVRIRKKRQKKKEKHQEKEKGERGEERKSKYTATSLKGHNILKIYNCFY